MGLLPSRWPRREGSSMSCSTCCSRLAPTRTSHEIIVDFLHTCGGSLRPLADARGALRQDRRQHDGQTAIDLARACNNGDVVSFLSEVGRASPAPLCDGGPTVAKAPCDAWDDA
mmetsp:Transcript_180159/g.571727  ORF Transcript_180159/g.571727 Transcript_180159/m.571727 type:complete len:114 (-) Transcript_180159:94-435(-)